MKNLTILVLIFISFFAKNSFAVENCSSLPDKLEICEVFSCEMNNEGKIFKHKIKGLQGDKCVHEQSNPSGSVYTCSYSLESRQFMAIQIRKSMKKEKFTELEQNLASDIFMNECAK
jgi:hypothetical protein